MSWPAWSIQRVTGPLAADVATGLGALRRTVRHIAPGAALPVGAALVPCAAIHATTDFAYLRDLQRACQREHVIRATGGWDDMREGVMLAQDFAAGVFWRITINCRTCGMLKAASDGTGLWLSRFYLDPSLHGRGVGTAVLRRALADADALGAVVRLETPRGSPARRLYERHGFALYKAEPAIDYLVRPAAS